MTKQKSIPPRLREILNEQYQGDLEQLVAAAKKCSIELYKLQGRFDEKKLMVPQLHNLKNYWSENARTELESLAEGLLDSSEDRNIAEVVQKSALYKKAGDLYGVPYAVKVKDAVPALAGGSLARMVGRFLPAPYGLVVTLLGVGVGGGREVWQRRVKNPFQQLGDALTKKVEQYRTENGARTSDYSGSASDYSKSADKDSKSVDTSREDRKGFWGK